MNATMLFRAMKFNQRQPSPAWKKLAAAFFLNALLPSAVLADVWFLGIGNDGYYTDVSGLRTAYQAVPNPSGTPLHFRTYSNRDGATILQDIGWLADNAGPGDLALFFYSGHGGSGDWSSYDERAGWASNPFDETIGLLSGDEITDDQLALAFARIDSRVPLFGVFDACHSGGMVGGTTDLNTLPNVYAMMSSREDEDSYGGFPYSRFTGELIRGIGYSLPADANDNGIVTFDEWFGYARDNVSGQNPVRFDSGGLGSLSIVPVPEPTTLALLATAAIGLLFWRRNRRFTISKMYSDRGGLDRVRSEIGEEIHRHRQKEDRNIKSHTTTLALGLILLMTGRSVTMAAQIGPDAFENPITFDFSDLAYGSHLGANYPNPYADLGVEFTGYIADYDGYGLHGHHLATGFDNTPPEPFVVRARFLDEPALRVGGYVWPEVGSRTSFTAFDEHGAAIESFTLSGAQFTGLEASVDLPIRYVEWRGLAGSGLSTFPRVDGVMVQRVPEPATLVLLVTAAAGIAFWWRKRRTSLRKTLNDWDGLDRLRFNIGTELRCRQTTGDETMKASATAIALSLVLLTTVGLRNAPAREIGPDAYDYLATNNIPYAWEDISLTGTRTLYGSDDGTASRNLGFPFNFYGHDYTSVSWSPNGLVTFGGTSGQYTNENLATSDGPANLPSVAALWDDWDSDDSGSGIYYETRGTPGDRRFILQWHNLDGYDSSPSTVTFQTILFEGSNDILLQYRDVYSGNSRNYGASATVGIRDRDGHLNGENLQWSYNAGVISSREAILYRVPEPATLWLLAAFVGCAALCGWFRKRARRQA